jgi:hypothetical protein
MTVDVKLQSVSTSAPGAPRSASVCQNNCGCYRRATTELPVVLLTGTRAGMIARKTLHW